MYFNCIIQKKVPKLTNEDFIEINHVQIYQTTNTTFVMSLNQVHPGILLVSFLNLISIYSSILDEISINL